MSPVTERESVRNQIEVANFRYLVILISLVFPKASLRNHIDALYLGVVDYHNFEGSRLLSGRPCGLQVKLLSTLSSDVGNHRSRMHCPGPKVSNNYRQMIREKAQLNSFDGGKHLPIFASESADRQPGR